MHCHHEKTIVVDDRVAFVGGIDLTSFQGDRWDTSAHRARAQLGWHDATSVIRGPAVADVAEHFRLRWHEVAGERLPPVRAAEEAGDVELQVVRTVPENVYDALPRGSFRILESYLRALRSARRLVYLENQFLWSQDVVDVLAEKLRQPPDDRFRCVLLLPADPNDGADETRGQLGQLAEADAGRGRLLGCTLFARDGELSDPVYVHAKVGIVDDEWLTVGSANLNNHSLFNDTEMNVVAHDPALVRAVRLRLWAEHLEADPAEVGGDPTDVVDERWRPLAEEELERARLDGHGRHKLRLLPHVSRRSKCLLGPLNGFLVDG
jgi:phosphatidylserine/phosphatidylglycerophosphate/cardiolipin synthase-like enzyme